MLGTYDLRLSLKAKYNDPPQSQKAKLLFFYLDLRIPLNRGDDKISHNGNDTNILIILRVIAICLY
jgi:hypothetical protein